MALHQTCGKLFFLQDLNLECGDAGEDEEGNKHERKLITDLSDHTQLSFTLSKYLKFIISYRRSNSCSNDSAGT